MRPILLQATLLTILTLSACGTRGPLTHPPGPLSAPPLERWFPKKLDPVKPKTSESTKKADPSKAAGTTDTSKTSGTANNASTKEVTDESEATEQEATIDTQPVGVKSSKSASPKTHTNKPKNRADSNTDINTNE